MKGLIVVRVDTVIKLRPVEDSSTLPRHARFELRRGETLEVEYVKYVRDANHYQIALSVARNGEYVWYAYCPHVEFIPEFEIVPPPA